MSESATHASEEQELDSYLDSHAGRQSNPVDDIDINAPIQIDTSDVEMPREKWAEGIYPVRATALRVTKASSGENMAIVTFTCFAGPLKDQTRNEFLMLGGKGLVKTCSFLEAISLYDRASKQIQWKAPVDLLGKDCWIVIEHVKQTSKRGTEFIADAIPFQNGFLSWTDSSGKPRYELPDLFSEPGQVDQPKNGAPVPTAPTPKASTPPAATPPVVTASAEPAPNW